MLWIVGFAIVLGSVILGFWGGGGHFNVLWQPFEFVIICGSALGGLLIGSTKEVLKEIPAGLSTLFRGIKYKKEAYVELLSVLYMLFKLSKGKGNLALEGHIEDPQNSPLFQKFPLLLNDEKARVFLCDYLRMMTMGTDNPHELENVMEQELETLKAQLMRVPYVLQQLAEGMPALGIVAAVLGVIHTMGAIAQPPEILGNLIGAALVGTFLGVLLCYGFFGPVAHGIRLIYTTDLRYYATMKEGILAYLHGYPPAVAVEFARKAIYSDTRPTFYEIEQTLAELPNDP